MILDGGKNLSSRIDIMYGCFVFPQLYGDTYPMEGLRSALRKLDLGGVRIKRRTNLSRLKEALDTCLKGEKAILRPLPKGEGYQVLIEQVVEDKLSHDTGEVRMNGVYLSFKGGIPKHLHDQVRAAYKANDWYTSVNVQHMITDLVLGPYDGVDIRQGTMWVPTWSVDRLTAVCHAIAANASRGKGKVHLVEARKDAWELLCESITERLIYNLGVMSERAASDVRKRALTSVLRKLDDTLGRVERYEGLLSVELTEVREAAAQVAEDTQDRLLQIGG